MLGAAAAAGRGSSSAKPLSAEANTVAGRAGTARLLLAPRSQQVLGPRGLSSCRRGVPVDELASRSPSAGRSSEGYVLASAGALEAGAPWKISSAIAKVVSSRTWWRGAGRQKW